MKYLYAPWRSKYVQKNAKKSEKESNECFICRAVKGHDDLVLYRGNHTIVLLNKYPYNYGHILVAPKRHVQNFEDLTLEEVNEMFNIISFYIKKIKNILRPEGFNVGVNLGSAAGASLPQHLHVHVVPRWQRDTAFMEILFETKVVSFDIYESYKKLKGLFENYTGNLSQDKSQKDG